MLRAVSSIVLFAWLGQAAAQTDAAVYVRLKGLALVHERQVALRDVAELTGADEDAVQRIGAVPLGKAPRAGYTEQLTLAAIQRAVRARLGDPDEAIVWEGGR